MEKAELKKGYILNCQGLEDSTFNMNVIYRLEWQNQREFLVLLAALYCCKVSSINV